MTATQQVSGSTAGTPGWGCRRAMNEERLRLAQEVHDVVGHGLVVIQMQADISRHVGRTDPEQVHIALDAISRAAAEALAELRTTLATLTPQRASGSGRCATTPGLHLLENLRRRVEQAGIALEVSVRGRRRSLPPAVDVAAYRVLQESLTNVVKHASQPRAAVEVSYLPDAVSVRVHNEEDVVGAGGSDGFGLGGMRRRVELLGGELTAGHVRHTRRFEVRATIPTR